MDLPLKEALTQFRAIYPDQQQFFSSSKELHPTLKTFHWKCQYESRFLAVSYYSFPPIIYNNSGFPNKIMKARNGKKISKNTHFLSSETERPIKNEQRQPFQWDFFFFALFISFSSPEITQCFFVSIFKSTGQHTEKLLVFKKGTV